MSSPTVVCGWLALLLHAAPALGLHCGFTVRGEAFVEQGRDGLFRSKHFVARLPWDDGVFSLQPTTKGVTGTWKVLEVPYMVGYLSPRHGWWGATAVPSL